MWFHIIVCICFRLFFFSFGAWNKFVVERRNKTKVERRKKSHEKETIVASALFHIAQEQMIISVFTRRQDWNRLAVGCAVFIFVMIYFLLNREFLQKFIWHWHIDDKRPFDLNWISSLECIFNKIKEKERKRVGKTNNEIEWKEQVVLDTQSGWIDWAAEKNYTVHFETNKE